MKLVLIGGGDYGTKPEKSYNLKEIDEATVKLTGKAHPRLLFLSFTIKSNFTFGCMKKHFMELGVQCEHLCFDEFSNQKTVDSKFKRADIVYIGGGNTVYFMQLIKKFGLDKKIIEAAEQNKVIAGRSAGAIIISDCGSSDSRKFKNSSIFTCVKGLGIFDVLLAPHYIGSGREQDIPRMLKNKKSKVAIGVDSVSALIVDGDNFEVISPDDKNWVYKCYYCGQDFVQKKLPKNGKVNDLIAKQ